mmetsp:Transcript_33258/g.83345  ORF Transcript_33258/g.83345 Transcript_33258/m.83345 type:complete len:232 (+) Transcript_33258:199-894(+)
MRGADADRRGALHTYTRDDRELRMLLLLRHHAPLNRVHCLRSVWARCNGVLPVRGDPGHASSGHDHPNNSTALVHGQACLHHSLSGCQKQTLVGNCAPQDGICLRHSPHVGPVWSDDWRHGAHCERHDGHRQGGLPSDVQCHMADRGCTGRGHAGCSGAAAVVCQQQGAGRRGERWRGWRHKTVCFCHCDVLLLLRNVGPGAHCGPHFSSAPRHAVREPGLHLGAGYLAAG